MTAWAAIVLTGHCHYFGWMLLNNVWPLVRGYAKQVISTPCTHLLPNNIHVPIYSYCICFIIPSPQRFMCHDCTTGKHRVISSCSWRSTGQTVVTTSLHHFHLVNYLAPLTPHIHNCISMLGSNLHAAGIGGTVIFIATLLYLHFGGGTCIQE